jgi:hypothetical protein
VRPSERYPLLIEKFLNNNGVVAIGPIDMRRSSNYHRAWDLVETSPAIGTSDQGIQLFAAISWGPK